MNEARTKALFQDALDLEDEEREVFLGRECGDDHGLRRRICELLIAHDEASDFLDSPATWLAGVDLSPDGPVEAPGDHVGDFELIERIGEGGFGVVWRARQEEPVHREVAVKVVKLGMDTAEVVARFEHEREALAMLDHPSIAKVFDAGATGDGRPWFAMELVDGEPITVYCDRHRLDVRARLGLFIKVCRAIQHAHLSGIIHRDIKPSNVMVSESDGKPLPRIIDFGIAKATNRSEAELTMFTSERHLLGTPEYMSPEQVETWGAGVDARTDVYSLGVLLFELLGGSRPFSARRTGATMHGEILRQIREDDPEHLSLRVAGMDAQEGTSFADRRRLSQRGLARELRGELDWIVLQALAKDRELRYATPVELAADVERYLRDEAVAAGPPSRLYRFRKFARRNRTWLAAAALVLVSMVAGTAFAVHGLLEAREAWAAETEARARAEDSRARAESSELAEREARERAEASELAEREARQRAEAGEERARSETEKFQLALRTVESMLTSADPRITHRADYTVREMMDQFHRDLASRKFSDPEVEARLRMVLGRTYRSLGMLDLAEQNLRRARELRLTLDDQNEAEVIMSRIQWAWLLSDRARYEEAVEEVDAVMATMLRRPPSDTRDEVLCGALDARSTFLMHLNRVDEAVSANAEAWDLSVRLYGEDHSMSARILSRRAHLLMFQGRPQDAKEVAIRALATMQGQFPNEHPEVMTLKQNLAAMHEQTGHLAEAERLHREVLEGRIAVEGEDHPDISGSQMSIGWLAYRRGDLEQADQLLREGIAGLRKSYGDEHPWVTEGLNRLGVVLHHRGKPEEAELILRDVLNRYRTLPGHRFDGYVSSWSNLGSLLDEQGRHGEALEELRGAVALGREKLPDPHPSTVYAMIHLADLYVLLGEFESAERLLQESIEKSRVLWGSEHGQVRDQERRLELLHERMAAEGGR